MSETLAQAVAVHKRKSKALMPASIAVAGVIAAIGMVIVKLGLAKRAESRNPPEGKFVEVDSVRLHYLEQGAGPVIALIHGNMVSASDFAISGLFDLLSQDHKVIAFDRRVSGIARGHANGFGHLTLRPS